MTIQKVNENQQFSEATLIQTLYSAFNTVARAVNRLIGKSNNYPDAVADYGASGDGSANDDAWFSALESDVSGQIINLNGKTHAVTAYPTKNTYVNGTFVIPKTTTVNGVADDYDWYAAAAARAFDANPANLFRDARAGRSSTVARLTQVDGLQSFCFDEVGSKAYGLHLTGSGASEVSYISQYELSPATATTKAALGTSNSHAGLGHQGLSIEYRNNSSTPNLWASIRYEATNYPSGNRQAMRFRYGGAASNITNIELYTLFGSEFSYTSNNTLPAVSFCQRFLVAVGRKSSRDFWIRVFDLPQMIAGGAGDYSDAWLYQFNVDTDILLDDASGNFRPVQGLACDGGSVYVLSGNSHTEAKRIDRYSLDGRLEQSQSNISVGLTEAQADGAGTFYEPEGLGFYRPDFTAVPALCMLILSGSSGARVNRIWALGYDRTITEGRSTLLSARWTPTLTNVTNVAASTAYSCHYSRLGNFVHFAGRVAIDPTAAGATVLEMSLPIASNFASLTDAAGSFGCNVTVDGGGIEGSVANDTLVFAFIASDVANRPFYFSGMYEVL